jgi:hypothetical protein
MCLRTIKFLIFLCWRTLRVSPIIGRESFLCVAKEKGPKERPPYRVGLRLLCALHLRAGAAELANAKTVLAHFRSRLPVLDNTKGIVRSITKTKSGWFNLMRSSEHHNQPLVIPANAGTQKEHKNGFRLDACRNDCKRMEPALTFRHPFRLAETHRMSRGLWDASV